MSAEPTDAALDFEIVDSERLHRGFREVDRITVRHASLVGEPPITVKREVVRAKPAAVILPFDPASGRIVAIRQFRIGAALSTPHAGALELPAGLIDEGEDAKTAAVRELAEETGLQAYAIAPAFDFLPSPGVSDEHVFMFLALVDAAHLKSRAGLAEESEEIVPLAFDADTLIDSADAGQIANGFLFAALQWFARRGHRVAADLGARADMKGHT